MSKHFAPAEFDTHPPELYGSAAQRDAYLPAVTESLVSSPDTVTNSTYTPLRTDEIGEGSNEYDYIPGESFSRIAAKSQQHASGGGQDLPQNTVPVSGEVGEGVGSSMRGKERKLARNSLYEEHNLKEELIHPTLKRDKV